MLFQVGLAWRIQGIDGRVYIPKGATHGPSYVIVEGQRELDMVSGVKEISEVIGTEETRLSVGRKRNKR